MLNLENPFILLHDALLVGHVGNVFDKETITIEKHGGSFPEEEWFPVSVSKRSEPIIRAQSHARQIRKSPKEGQKSQFLIQ